MISFSLKVIFFIYLIFLLILIGKWNQLPPQLPLFYSLPRGEDQLVVPLILFILPISSLVIFFLHLVVSIRLSATQRLASQIMIISASIISAILLITFINIIYLVT